MEGKTVIPKKLMREFFAAMLQREHPGEGAQVGELTRKKREGLFHWKVEIFIEGECLEIDPLIWLKIRGSILQESFGEAIENCPTVKILPTIRFRPVGSTAVSAVIQFEESKLVGIWPGLLEGENPYR